MTDDMKVYLVVFCVAIAPLGYVTGKAVLERPQVGPPDPVGLDPAMQEVATRTKQAEAPLAATTQVAGYLAGLHPLAALQETDNDPNPGPARTSTAGLEGAKSLLEARKITLRFLTARQTPSTSRLEDLQNLATELDKPQSVHGIDAFRTSIGALVQDLKANDKIDSDYAEAVKAYDGNRYDDAVQLLAPLSRSPLDAKRSQDVRRLQYLAGLNACLAHWSGNSDYLRDTTQRKKARDEFEAAARKFERLPAGLEGDSNFANEAATLKTKLQDNLTLAKAWIEFGDFCEKCSGDWKAAAKETIEARVAKAKELLDKYPSHAFIRDELAADTEKWLLTVCKPKSEVGFGQLQEARWIETGEMHGAWVRGIWEPEPGSDKRLSYRPSPSDPAQTAYVDGYIIKPRQIESERVVQKYNLQLDGLKKEKAWKTQTAWGELAKCCAELEQDLETYRKQGGDRGGLSFSDEQKAAQAISDAWAGIEALLQKLQT